MPQRVELRRGVSFQHVADDRVLAVEGELGHLAARVDADRVEHPAIVIFTPDALPNVQKADALRVVRQSRRVRLQRVTLAAIELALLLIMTSVLTGLAIGKGSVGNGLTVMLTVAGVESPKAFLAM